MFNWHGQNRMVPRPVQLEVAENAAAIDLKGSDREK